MRPLEALSSQLSLLSILHNVDNIEDILQGIEENRPDLLQEAVNMVKNAVQEEARQAWVKCGYWALLVMATGTGKSKIPINILKRLPEEALPTLRVLILVPTEQLRDTNWQAEFSKWGASWIYENCVERVCYASIDKIKGQTYDLVIGDEFHNITPNNSVFFKQNTIKRFVGLTATEPKNYEKLRILRKLPTAYTIDVDTAVRLKLVSDYEIILIECELDDEKKVIKGGNKHKTFFTTEKQHYDYLDRKVQGGYGSFKSVIGERMRFIKTLPSKTENAKFILGNVITPDSKTLIFCGGIEQSIELCDYRYFSKPSAKKDDPKPKRERVERILEHYEGDKWLIAFMNDEIKKLSCISAINEGINIPNVDNMLVTSLESVDITITQQIGRIIRFRIYHKGKVYILFYPETQELLWVEKALVKFDPSKIRRVSMKELKEGVLTL